MQNVIKKK
jgi:hypothetical protein